MCMDILLACKSVYHMHHSVRGGQTRVLDPLEPELLKVVNCHVYLKLNPRLWKDLLVPLTVELLP